jgi:hypothetical protein
MHTRTLKYRSLCGFKSLCAFTTRRHATAAEMHRGEELADFRLAVHIYIHTYQCCHVAEISAKKLKRGQRKIMLAGRIYGRISAEFLRKVAEKGP